MGKCSLREFVSQTSEKDRGEGLFELESARMLEVNLDGMVWTKMGTMVGYDGNIKFTRERILEHGIGRLLKKTVTGEGVNLTKAQGRGHLYLAGSGKKVTIIQIERSLPSIPCFRSLNVGRSGDTYRFALIIVLGRRYGSPEKTAKAMRLCATQKVKDAFEPVE